MKWLLIAGIAIAAPAVLVGIAALIGSRLPQAHVASREAQLPAPPTAVWDAITDIDGYSTWRRDVSRVEHLPDRAVKKTWVEHGRNGRITFTVDRAEPPRLLAVRIADPDLPFGGTWTYEISPVPDGTALKITEQGEVYSPIFRFMSRFVFGHEATMTTYLTALEKRFTNRSSAAR